MLEKKDKIIDELMYEMKCQVCGCTWNNARETKCNKIIKIPAITPYYLISASVISLMRVFVYDAITDVFFNKIYVTLLALCAITLLYSLLREE